jgi:hypothetical protein
MSAASRTARIVYGALAPAARGALARRIRSILLELEPQSSGNGGLSALAAALPGRSTAELWLVLSAFHAQLPRPTEVRRLRRILEIDSGWDAVSHLVASMPSRFDPRFRPGELVLTAGASYVDVTGLIPGKASGEGRGVGRRLLREWAADQAFVPVTWTTDGRMLRGLSPEERGALGLDTTGADLSTSVIVPNGGSYILLGIADLPRHAERLIALGQYSAAHTATVGYGLGPILHAEDYPVTDGSERFTWHLAAQRSMGTLVSVGEGIDVQYRGWRRMLSAVGIIGPELVALDIPQSGEDAWTRFARDCADALALR